jgi:REP element-mobilizing transposase RayT
MESRRKSIRIKDYDYSSPGAYFVTMVTKERAPIFGLIEDGRLNLSKIGEIAKLEWDRLPLHFSEIKTDEFVIMPNHIHCIIFIAESQVKATLQNRSCNLVGKNIDQCTIMPYDGESPQRESIGQVRATLQNQPGITLGEGNDQQLIMPYDGGSPQQESTGLVRATLINQPGTTLHEGIDQQLISSCFGGSPQRESTGQVRATLQNQPGTTLGEGIDQQLIPSCYGGSPQRESTGQVRATLQNRSGILAVDNNGQQVILSRDGGSPQQTKGPKPGSIGAIIGQYKSRVTKRTWRDPKCKGREIWQRNYYEHIIRDREEYNRIVRYILDNPSNWPKDEKIK